MRIAQSDLIKRFAHERVAFLWSMTPTLFVPARDFGNYRIDGKSRLSRDCEYA